MATDKQKMYSEELTPRVVILENEKHAREGMVEELESSGIEVVGASADPQTILALIEEQNPNVAIMDLRIRGQIAIGLEAIRDMKQRRPNVKCIVITSYPTLQNFLHLVHNIGVECFMRKESEELERHLTLPHLVKMIASGGKHYDAEWVKEILQYIDESRLPREGIDFVQDIPNPLSDRERGILTLVGSGCNNTEIAEKAVISENTVKAHLQRIYSKLGVNTREQAAMVARLKGWI